MTNPSSELEPVAQALGAYSDELLRVVAAELFRPRSQWPRPELIDRALATLGNPATIDRRLKDLEPECRRLLALLAHSGRSTWQVGSLVEMLVTLGPGDGLAPVQRLLQTGLLYPVGAASSKTRWRGFDAWLGSSAVPAVFAPDPVLKRCRNFDLNLPAGPEPLELPQARVLEADGLDWPLRLAVLWQQLQAGPLRRTLQGDFFKRDLDRLKTDPLLITPAADALTDLPDPGLFTVALAAAIGLTRVTAGEVHPEPFDTRWQGTLATLLADLFAALPEISGWHPLLGWQPAAPPGNPFPSAVLLALLLLTELQEGQWLSAQALETWLVDRHPYWTGRAEQNSAPKKSAKKASLQEHGLACWLLGVLYPLRMVQATRAEDSSVLIRLSPLGRSILGFDERPPSLPTFPQTLLVQPNLEILAYRQGLTPALIVQLTRCATWKTLGAACTLQLEPASVYRALEAGESFTTIVQTLERHGMKSLPPAVLDSLRTWAEKRDRITIWSSAALFEFPSAQELNDALARGLPAVRLGDRLAVVADENQIDYKHFRLTGTRDYGLPPEKCVEVESDGVTLNIDLAKSDLLLESEVQRFAESLPGSSLPGRKLYRITPASMTTATGNGWSLSLLEAWFQQRTGLPLSPAARLLCVAAEALPAELRRQLVLHVASSELADGLLQWPATRDLIKARLGPTALVVAEKDVAGLTEKMKELTMRLHHGDG